MNMSTFFLKVKTLLKLHLNMKLMKH